MFGEDETMTLPPSTQMPSAAWILIEHGFLVRDAIGIRVLQNHDAVPSRLQDAPLLKCRAIVDAFGDPNPSARVDVHVGGIPDHRFRREQGNLQTIRHGKLFHRLARGFGPDTGRVFGE